MMRTGSFVLLLVVATACIGGCRQAQPQDSEIVTEQVPTTVQAPTTVSDTLTLSAEQLMALDWSGRSPSGGTVIRKHAVDTAGAVFDIQFPGNRAWQNSIKYVSTGSGGRGTLVGLDVSSYQTFALKFTLVAIDGAVGPSLPQELTVGAVVGPTVDGKLSTYKPYTLSFADKQTAIVKTPITVARLREIGFYMEMANPEKWSENGARVTLLIEPAADAVSPAMPVIEEEQPEKEPRPKSTNVPDFGPGRTGAW